MPETEYIDRNALLKSLSSDEHAAMEDYYYNAISSFQSSDVAPVIHAKWIEYPVAHYFKCSVCKYTVPFRKAVLINGKRAYNYCPSCGAKMDLDKEGNKQ